MKDKNLSYKNNAYLKPKDFSYTLEVSMKKALLHIYEARYSSLPNKRTS